MKNTTKRLLGILLAMVLASGSSICAFAADTVSTAAAPALDTIAATATSPASDAAADFATSPSSDGAAGTAGATTPSSAATADFSVTFQNGNKMIFKQKNKTYTYEVKNTDVTLTTDAAGNFLICYYNASGTYRAMTLKQQKSLSISGALASLTISEELSSKVNLNLYANVSNLSLSAANQVNVYGKVGNMDVYSAAIIAVKNGGVVSVQTLRNSKATVSVEKGGSIGKSNVIPDPAPKPAPTKRTYRLDTSTIYTTVGTRLADLRGELNRWVTAYDAKNSDDVPGTVAWTKPGSTVVNKDGTYSFTFKPDSAKYASMTGKISICADEVHVDTYLYYNSDTISITANQTLNELQPALTRTVYVLDIHDNLISGRLQWNDPPYTIAEQGGYYNFTFIPSSSKYNQLEGSLRMISELAQGTGDVPVVDDDAE